MVLGAIVGAIGGFIGWMITYRRVVEVPMWTLALYMIVGAAVLGHVAGATRGRVWGPLFDRRWHRWARDVVSIFR